MHTLNLNQIQTTQKVLLFLGFDHNIFDQFYQHFENKKTLQEVDFFKIVRLQKYNRNSILINSPHLLFNIDDKEEIIKICSSKINLENVLSTLTRFIFHVVINLEKVKGNNQKEKLQNIINLEILKFGKFKLYENKISILTQVGQQVVSYAYLENFRHANQITMRQFSVRETLKQIFKKDKFSELQQLTKPSDISYGAMSRASNDKQLLLKTALNKIIDKILRQLYCLQQIPKLEEEQELRDNLVNFFKELSESLKYFKVAKFSDMPKIFAKINFINEQTGNKINNFFLKMDQSYKELHYNEFLKSQEYKFEDLLIKSFLKNVEELELINNFFLQYNSFEYERIHIGKLKNLLINIEFWNEFCKSNLENKLYQIQTVASLVQPEPEQNFEQGVFFFGKSRVGKSTIINLIINPQNLTVKKELGELRYVFKEKQENNPEFNIGYGCVSETQKISFLEQGGVWYFDCPGFDDNISELKRLAHRISLYNYLIKTKKVIGFLVIDGSNQDASIIKDTIDPLYLIIKQKSQLVSEHYKWLSLILAKTNPNTRKEYKADFQVFANFFLNIFVHHYHSGFKKQENKQLKKKVQQN